MLKPPTFSLSIASSPQAQLSKNQKTFNRLIRQIAGARARLAAWDVAIPRYQHKYTAELQPLYGQARALESQSLHALDKAHDMPGLTKTERRKIAFYITDLAQELLAESSDDALKALYSKHSGTDYDAALAEDTATLRSAVKDIFGVDLGDDMDPDSPEDFLQQAEAKFQEQHARREAAREQRNAKRKKTPGQIAKEAREQADAQQLKLSIREIYRKLASALHPDREPDPQERERKTLLMQKVNQAYDKNNLLQLLELQLELEQIDQDHINNVSDERLRHYNKILREQLAELQHETLRVEAGFMAQFMLDPFEPPDPATIMKQLAADIVEARREIRELQHDLQLFDDVKKLKLWLKKVRLAGRRDALANEFF